MQILGRLFGAGFTLSAVAAAIVAAVLASQRLDHRPRTDDAFINADVVHMAPDVSGRVVSLAVRENQAVKAGDLLFTIDPEPYRLQLAQAQAQLSGLHAQLAVTTDQVASQGSKADAANTGIGSAQAQLSLASSTLSRMEPLLPRALRDGGAGGPSAHRPAHRAGLVGAGPAAGAGGAAGRQLAPSRSSSRSPLRRPRSLWPSATCG